jgi:Family of unknown function (DUF6194)
VDQQAIIDYVNEHFDGVRVIYGSGPVAVDDTFFLYDPQRILEGNQQFPFATIVTKDYGDFDNLSNLNRPGVFRLNVGISRDTFRRLFPDAEATYDYSALDTLIPHPVYAPQSWVSVLNPSAETFESAKPLLQEAYENAVRRLQRVAG